MGKTYVPAIGNPNARIAIVGESPSYEEERALQPFVGPSGRFLDLMLKQVGISRSECWITNACKYSVPPNPKSGKKISFKIRAQHVGIDIDDQLNELHTELTTVKPNIIIALGGTALWATTGKFPIQKWRGSLIPGLGGIKTIGTYHPAHILHQEGDVKGYWNKQVMRFDLSRAVEQSTFPQIERPIRDLRIIENSGQFYQFVERNKGNSFPSIDIEAYDCIPICIGIAFSPSVGVTVPLWNTGGISNIHSSDLVTIWRMLSEFLSEHEIVGQNFGYDRDKIRRLGFIVKSLHSDTMLKSFVINPELPKNLAFNTSLYTLEPYYKDEGMYDGSVNDLLIGCARDACVTKEVDLAMDHYVDKIDNRDYYEKFLLPLHSMYHYDENFNAIEQIGFRVNESFRHELIRKYIEQDETIRYQLWKLTGKRINCNSPKQVSTLLYEDFKLPIRAGTGEEVLSGLLNNTVRDPVQAKIIELILENRRIRKTIGTYLYSLADYDGRMRSSYFLCLETGRSATSQQEAPIRPNIKIKVRDEENKLVNKTVSRGMAFQTITKHGDIGHDIRKMLVADPGYVFIQADSSQAEARVIFLLADDLEALHDIDNCDYHALTASWFFGGSEKDYSKKVLGYESPKRFAGKTLRHACHLGALKRRAAIEVNTQARKYKINYSISEAQAGKAIEVFHAKQPKIRSVFHSEVRRIVETTRKLAAPVPYGIAASTGGIRTFFERSGEELFRQALSYIPQRTVSENTKGAGMRVRSRVRDIKILVESHDALLFMVPETDVEDIAPIIKQEFERPIDFATCSIQRGLLSIPCELEIGYNYKDLNNYKFKE